MSKKSVSFVGGTVSADAVAAVRGLIALPGDQARLEALKLAWAAQPQEELDELVHQATKELEAQATDYSSSAAAFSFAAYTRLRNLLGLVSLLARREYPSTRVPLEFFPGCIESILVLVEAIERRVEGDDAGDAKHAIKFHALHAFNRLLETFPAITAAFVPLMLDMCTREMFPGATSASASALPDAAVSPSYGTKLLETLGLIVATSPAAVVSQSHVLLKHALELIAVNLADIDSFEPETPAKTEAADAKATLPAKMLPLHTYTLSLLDFSSTLMRKIHARLPVSYPSSRMLHPRAWPFGSEELGERDEDEEEPEEKEEADEDEDDEEEGATAPAPRQCYTEALVFNPARKGALPLAMTAEEASDLFGRVLTCLQGLHSKVGVEGVNSTAPGAVNDHGTTILSFLPLVVALDNLYAGSLAAHGEHVESTVSFLIDQLRELDFATFNPSLAASAHQLLQAIEGVCKQASREPCVEAMPTLYNDLVNWLADTQAAFPRAAFIKLRRFAVAAFMALLYVLDVEFQSLVGSASFFSELFPLLANPLLTSHLIWILRSDREHVEKKVLPQVMRGLLNTNTRSSPSMKTVTMILTSIGNVACFTRAFETTDAQGGKLPATLPLLEPFMGQILETIINTMEKSPSGTGQIASLVLCRIVMAGYDMSEVQTYLPRVLSLYARIVDESLFVSEQAELGEEYDDDDQDLVSQLQYCVLDMLHVWFQDLKEAAADPIARGVTDDKHPFRQADLLQLVASDEDSVDALRDIVQVLLENTKKPIFFNDDAALRNSEIHLVKEILAHGILLQPLFTPPKPEEEEAAAAESSEPSVPLAPLTPTYLITTLLQSILLAKEDGQAERKFNYVLCLSSLASSLNGSSDGASAAIKAALEEATHATMMAEVKRDAATSEAITQAGWTN